MDALAELCLRAVSQKSAAVALIRVPAHAKGANQRVFRMNFNYSVMLGLRKIFRTAPIRNLIFWKVWETLYSACGI